MTTHPTDTTRPTDDGDVAPGGHDAARRRLREALTNFAFDEPGVVRPFTKRLADERGWTPAYAAQVVREYLRFIELAVTGSHSMTPSVAVDEAWHMHLCYTQSYWGDLCGRVLGRPLHHEPSTGGPDEARKFRELYRQTLVAYTTHFHEAPPRDVWPEADLRSGGADVTPERDLPSGGADVRDASAPDQPSGSLPSTVERWVGAAILITAAGLLVVAGPGSVGFVLGVGVVTGTLLAAVIPPSPRTEGTSDDGGAGCSGGCGGGCCGA